MPADHRYIQPQSAKEAMELIQKLFNSYRNAPLTSELLNYHNNLVARLNDDIMAAATTEGPKRVEQLTGMIELMQAWTRIRLSGRPFLGKMRHFTRRWQPTQIQAPGPQDERDQQPPR